AAQTVFVRGADPRWIANEVARGRNLLALAELEGDAPETRDEAARTTLQAIAAMGGARPFVRREDNPQRRATVQLTLAKAYGNNAAGAPEDSERRAIDIYEAFLAAISREDAPSRWAEAHAQMAHLLLGNQFRSDAKNVERAVRSLNAAATIY